MSNTIRVLSTLAIKGAVPGLANRYHSDGGARLEAEFAPTLALLQRLRAGETADVVILTREGLDDMARGDASPPGVAWIWRVPGSVSR